jgi:hypothetical protein
LRTAEVMGAPKGGALAWQDRGGEWGRWLPLITLTEDGGSGERGGRRAPSRVRAQDTSLQRVGTSSESVSLSRSEPF